ncbi:MAG TPA: hypothetical protein VMJ10_15330 [Kofleriaceae bacterium]|nr:hypothetical protein [Kofleriaceae bacterium]
MWNLVVMLVHVALSDRRGARIAHVLPITRNDGSRIWRTQISP